MNVEYRSDQPNREQYFRLFESSGWNGEYRADIAELETATAAAWHSLSAYDDDKLIGFGRILSDGVLYGFIVDLIVDPDYQQRGIGRELLNRLTTYCKEAGLRDIQLFCAPGKIEFYEKMGFEVRPADAPGMRLRR